MGNIPDLPDALIFKILEVAEGAGPAAVATARLVCKEAHAAGDTTVMVQASDPDLPLWLLQTMWTYTSTYFKSRVLHARVIAGDVAAVTWLLDQDCTCDIITLCTAAAGAGQLEVLQHLRARGLPWDASTTAAAAGGGHIKVLQWLRAQSPPCPWDTEACFEAAGQGQLAVLAWLRQQSPPAPWCGAACMAAALQGDLSVLVWLRQQVPPCPWGSCTRAAASGKPEVMRWLKAQGAP